MPSLRHRKTVYAMAITKGPKSVKVVKKQKQKRDEEADVTGGENGKMVRAGHASSCSKGSGGDDIDICVTCGRSVMPTHQGLQCDECGFWHHTTCEKVTVTPTVFRRAIMQTHPSYGAAENVLFPVKKVTSTMM